MTTRHPHEGELRAGYQYSECHVGWVQASNERDMPFFQMESVSPGDEAAVCVGLDYGDLSLMLALVERLDEGCVWLRAPLSSILDCDGYDCSTIEAWADALQEQATRLQAEVDRRKAERCREHCEVCGTMRDAACSTWLESWS